jgi:hypothetical protein
MESFSFPVCRRQARQMKNCGVEPEKAPAGTTGERCAARLAGGASGNFFH